MNLISDGNHRGLRKLSILATALVLLILAGLLIWRKSAPIVAPESKQGEYARTLPEEKFVRPPPAKDSPVPELDPLEKSRKAAPVEKSVAKSDPLASVSNPIFASAGEGDGRFTIRDRNVSAWFTDRGVTLAAVFPNRDAGPNVLAMNWGLVGAQAVKPRPEEELVTRINRFVGDSSKWQTNMPSYSRIAYDEVMPGVDVTIDSRPHALKYTVRLAAGVDPSVLQFRYEGADAVEVAEDGKSLQVVSVLGAMAEGQLEVWQENGGGRIPVAARYEKIGMNGYAIRLDGVNPDLPLTVDPTFSWGTFIGGSQNLTGGDDTGRCIVTDSGNNPWVGGSTQSADFPTSAGVMQRKNLGSGDGFVAKFTLTDGLVWTTFIGGSGGDTVLGIKLDSSNNPVVVGTTSSFNFPTTANAFQPGYTPINSNTTTGFVAKLNGSTAQLIWSSYLGGSTTTQPQALAIDSNNEIYVTGYTDCVDLPGVAGNYQPAYNGGGDAFVMKVKAGGGGIGWATYLGGTGYDFGTCIAVDANFNSYIGGYTNTASAFPSTGVFLGTAGSYDGFVTKLNPTGTAPVYSRLVGGGNTDFIKGIAIDTALPPAVYITGYTYNTGVAATNWPINLGPAHGAYYDAFITKVQPAGDFLAWSRYLGGNSYDYGYGVAYDATDSMVFVSGTTSSTDFPCTVSAAGPPTIYTAYKSALTGSSDIFVSRLSTAGVLCYSSYFGGSGSEDGNAVATTLGWFWITGYTNSANFPTTAGAWSTTLNGSSDAYITRLNPFQNGASSLIASTFLGGTHGVSGMSNNFRSMGVDSAGNVAIGGYTSSIDYPTTSGAIRTSNAAGLTKGVVTKLPADGSATSPPMWSTYLGGSNSDYLLGLAMNPAGDVFVTGYTYSTDFPTTGSYRTTLTGGEDTFVTRIRADGALLQYSTYLGGATSGDYGYYIAIDSNNNAYVTGEAYSTDFPWTANAVKKVQGGGQDMFVTKFNSAGTLQYSTYLGGDNDADYPTGLAVDNNGFAYITGNTYSFDYPIVGGLPYGFDGYACFVTKLNTNALAYGYSTFIGGSGSEYPTCIAVDSLGSVVIGGYTDSTDFPVTLGAVQTSHHGSFDGFVTKISAAGNSLDWSTFLGGTSDDYVYSVAFDGNGNVYATGPTRSSDFPMTPPLLNPFYVGSFDVFATRINAGGSTLAWSTYIGGMGDDYSYSVSVGPGGNVYVSGITGSPDFPVTGGTFSTTKSGNQDFFVARINNDPPAPPGSLAQYRSNGTTVIGTGGSTNEPSIIMKGISGDPEGDNYKLQVEVRAVGIAFTSPSTIPAFGVDFFEGAFVPAGTTATVTVTGRTNPTQYHWQARSVDASGAASAWVTYGGNSEFVPPSTPAATDFRVDTVPPTLSIFQSNPTYTQATNIGLSGNVNDDVAIFQVQWVNSTNSTNGFATITPPTTWNSGSITLQSGVVNVITVTVTDTAGNTNTGTQQISVVQDSTPPSIATSSPTSGSSFTTKNATVTLSGTTSDLNGVTSMSYQSPNGTFAITPPPFGSWSAPNVALNPGVNSVTIFAVDPAGNVGSKVMSLTSDPTPPSLTIVTPLASGTYYTSLGTVTLTGSASDAITTVTSVQWQLGGGPLNLASGLASWSTGSIGIVDGSNSINIIATDAATNTATAPLTVFKDPNPPNALDIASNVGPPAWPANPTTIFTNNNSITFAGTASDNPTASSGLLDVKWSNALAGSNGTASGTTSWNTGTIGLLPGSNTITITARDRALNPLSRVVTVVYDNQPPTPIINSPATGSYLTSATTISLGGTVSDSGGGSVASMSWSTTGAVAPSSGTVSFASGNWPTPAGSLVINLAGGVQTITVTATDTAGNSAFTTLTVTRDVTPPGLGITTPAVDPFYTTGNSVNLAGTASDASGIQNVTYLVNGTGPFTASGTTSWNANNVPILVGSNSISITAKDNSNLTTTLGITVIRDNGNPTVAITSPSGSSFVTKNATLAISGTAGDDFKVNAVQWSTGGGFTNATLVAVTPPSSYTWSASIPLSAGVQTVTIRAVDAAGNISLPSPTLSVTLDQTNPQINFTAPTTLTTFLTSSSQLPAVTPPPAAIAGTASDNVAVAQIEYSVNGAAFVVIAGATTSFTVPTVNLNPGSNTIDIRATDTAGNPFIKTMTVTYDNVPPGVSIATPQPSGIFYTSATTVTLSGSASDANGINKIEWRNSHPAAGTYAVIPGATTSWTTPAITLDQVNDNVIDIRATDNAGNLNVGTLTVRYDNTKPTIAVTAPPAVTKTTPITISGTSSDAGAGVTGISWTRVEGGASGVVSPPFAAWSTSVPLANGTNTITFTATDGAGNTQAATAVVVVLDTTNPTVTISAPTSSATYYTNQANVNLGGSASDNVALQKLEYQINGGALTAVTPVNPWTLTNVPVSGTTVINLVATDTATNTGSKSITVITDLVPPTINVTPPSPSIVNTTSVIISGTASDALSGIATVTWSRLEGSATGSATYTGPGWSASVPLVAGTNTFTFTATDLAGNPQAAGAVVVTRDNTNPIPVITAPGFPTYATNNATLTTLAGTASDNISLNKVEYRLNGAGGFLATSGSAASWNVPSIGLSAGSNTIEVLATDTAGNTGLVTLTVILDTTKPTVAITTPVLGTLGGPGTYATGTSPVSIGGTASDAVGIQRIDWTNTTTSVSGSTTGTSWSVSIPLTAGPNSISVTSVDTAGNVSVPDTLTVTLDTSAAIVTITTPTTASSFATPNASITISGNSSHSTGIQKLEWRNNGLPVGWNLIADAGAGFALASSAFTFAPALSVPTNVIEVRATPKAGTASIGTITILYDTTPPTVDITTNSGNNFATNISPITLTGPAGAAGVSGLASVVWVNAATSGTQNVTSTSWTASVGLTPGPNLITLTAKNGAGTAVSKSITVTYDLTLPTVNITGPTTNSTFQTTAGSIALAGTASDNVALASVQYQVNGGALNGVTLPLTNWTVPSIVLPGTGVYVINVIATDTAGNTNTDTLTVTRDIDKPTLTITSPADGSFTNSSPIVVTGTASDNQALASVTWTNAANSTSGTASGTTSWTASGITLAAGPNVITVHATDTLGNFLDKTVTVTYDTTVPVVNIVSPTSGLTWATNAATVDLSGTVTDNDQVASVSATNAANNFTVVSGTGAFPNWTTNGITLIAGANAITVTATDRSGNTSTKVLTVTLDTTKPTIAVMSPVASGGTYVTGASSLQIGGTAGDDLAVQKVDWSNPAASASGTAAGTTTWVATVPLVSGPNVISFTATDSAGNISAGTVSITVTRDTSLPSINIVVPDPLSPAITKIPSITVSGDAQDSEGMAQVTWSNSATGGSGTATGGSAGGGLNAPWSASIPLSIGVNTITVTAIDISGNTSTDTVDVTLDIAAPTVSISVPTSGPSWIVQGLSVALGGQTTDNIGLQSVSVTNSALAGTTSANITSGLPAWTIPSVPLAVGTNILTVTSTDKAGNTATAVLTVTSDGTAPSVAITEPTTNPTFYTKVASVSLGGTASDNVGLQKVDWSNANTGGLGTAIGTSVWAVSIPLGPGSNAISVTSTDTSGRVSAPATITVILDTTSPVIAVTAPSLNLVPNPPTYVTNLGPIAFGGTVTDAGGIASVTWSNIATGGSGSATVDTVPVTPTWSASIPVTNGLNGIVFTATDVAGNTTTTTVNATFDTVSPTVSITAPTNQPNYITNSATVALGGTAADNVAIQNIAWTNSANSTSGSAGSSSPWSVASVNLAAGDNPISVTVTDTAGNSTTALVVVRRDINAPSIAITSPVASLGTYVTNLSTVSVSGTASDDVAILGVTVNGSPATLAGTWTGVASLVAGPNTITAVATDTAGNTTSTSITVILDTTAPTMAVSGHNDGDVFSTVLGTVTLTGTAADPGGALQTVSWSNTTTGGSGTAVGTGSWTAPIALTPGTNIIIITTRDAAGNITQETLTIVHDTQAPTISINSPTAASTYNTTTSPITLGGGAADNVNVASVTWTNASTGVSGGTTGLTTAWSASVPLVVGSNTITVTATDDVGNSTLDTITVTYDPTAPVITITSPTPSPTYSTIQTPLNFAGTASDNLTVASITWNNTTAGAVGSASGTTAWTANGIPLISGLNTIVFTVTDGVGNTQTATVVVTYDVTPPTVVITPPVSPTQVRPLILTGTAVDNIGVSTVTWSNSLTGSSGTTTFAAPNWSASIPMIPGLNVVTIKATDALGNLGTASVTVDYSHETVAPALTIVNPAPPTFTSPTQLVTINGTATDNVGVTLISWINKTTRVYGIATYTAPNWTTEVPLADGPNVIDITASDDVGNVITQTITITFVATVDTNPPSITITAPTSLDTFDVTSSPLHLEANAIDDIGVVSVTWTNQGTFGSGDSGWGTFWYADIPLAAGVNVITVTATDTSGNKTTDTITVTYNPPVGDPVPPLVFIVTPVATGTFDVSTPVVAVTGTSSDNNRVDTVTLSNSATGAFETASGTTSWSAATMTLNAGVNVITARAVDPAGNVGQTTLVVVYTPPAAAKPVAPFIPAGMCGCTGLEALLALGALWVRRRCRRRA